MALYGFFRPRLVRSFSLLAKTYRHSGHLQANLDPLGLYFQSGSETLSKSVSREDMGGIKDANQEEKLRRIYCGCIGAEFSHVEEAEQEFLAGLMETETELSPATRRNLHLALLKSETLDHFLGIKFSSFKRYGCEGAESMLVAMEGMFAGLAREGNESVVIGMPHRGRLNLLVTSLGYPASALFAKIKGLSLLPKELFGECDVASHIATSISKTYDGKKIQISLMHNPSHLEAINPVAMGKTRAKQDAGTKSVCVLLHGDAAFFIFDNVAGQGVVAESLCLSQLEYYTVGGAIHLIVNNQVGYTTLPPKSRSTRYASDVAKMINAPVFHVNGNSPEDVAKVVDIAVKYRQKFKKDVVIDLIVWRKYGHNEVDEPSFTQPVMYNHIRGKPSVVASYGEKLTSMGIYSIADQERLAKSVMSVLENEWNSLAKFEPNNASFSAFAGKWNGFHQNWISRIPTGVSKSTLMDLLRHSATLPTGFNLHPRLSRTHCEPRLSVKAESPLDWSSCELLALGSALLDGNDVRISGQDVQRGTFSQRHASFTDQKSEELYTPLDNLRFEPSFAAKHNNIGKAFICNSPLSEFAVMGFEYGYSLESPKALVIWEAQFGDFYNGAQIILDNFLFNSESKWMRSTGLVLLLPHGYDGAGPEHSSCHLERFLQLSSEDPSNLVPTPPSQVNMLIYWPSTPAQYFHILRKQTISSVRKPAMVVAPKTLLRDPRAVSSFSEMDQGTEFHAVLGESGTSVVENVIFCNGKMFYEIRQKLKELSIENVRLVRIEQIAPFPFDDVKSQLSGCPKLKNVILAQEEPANNGIFVYLQPRIQHILNQIKSSATLTYVGRPASAQPATGVGINHKREHEYLYKSLLDCLKR